jgi:competence protein ComEA
MKKTKNILLPLLFCIFSVAAQAGPVNVNTADAETLAAELKGVGISRARAIVDYRQSVGPYQSPEDLLEVSGVGPKVLELNEGNIRVSGSEGSSG